MGFQRPDLIEARSIIGCLLVEIYSSFNDGWTQMSCKKQLYVLKFWLDHEYSKLPENQRRRPSAKFATNKLGTK